MRIDKIKELKEKVEFVNKHVDRIESYEYVEDMTILLEQNQRLLKALEELLNHTSGAPYQDISENMYRLLEARAIVQNTLQAYKEPFL